VQPEEVTFKKLIFIHLAFPAIIQGVYLLRTLMISLGIVSQKQHGTDA
jgi:hypothetical protein